MQGFGVREAVHQGLACLLLNALEMKIAMVPGFIAHVHHLVTQYPCDACMTSDHITPPVRSSSL